MRCISDTTEFSLKNSVVTLGKFDGLHIGHQLLLNHVVELKNEGYQSVVFSFSMHPKSLFSRKEMKLIYTEQEKEDELRKMGVDVYINYPFTQETASCPAEKFIEEVLVKQLDAKVIVVGSDFGFGYQRKGNVELLKQLEEKFGYKVYCYDKVLYHQKEVSSTRIRQEINEGNMSAVNHMLGKNFYVSGTVLHGRKLGRTLGIPTLNIIPEEEKLLPPNGVYLSVTKLNGKEYNGVTNIGLKPTVGGEAKIGVETYLFDYQGNAYGENIQVKLFRFQRGEVKFGSIDELKSQMSKDVLVAKQIFLENLNKD